MVAEQSIVNEREYKVVALRRSGHHAIINWLIKQSPGFGCFLNNCQPSRNPFESYAKMDSQLDHVDACEEARGNHRRKDYLVYNFEDIPLGTLSEPQFDKNCEIWLGKSRQRFRVIVLRDPFNLIASKLRWAEGKIYRPSLQSLSLLPGLWKQYAEEFSGTTRMLDPSVNVNYNQWVANLDYRRSLAETLGLQFTDSGIEEVAKWGPSTWGDSFDGLKYDGKAQQMKVTERWKAYASNPLYRKLVSDPDLIQLSEEIFGRIPGTEVLYA